MGKKLVCSVKGCNAVAWWESKKGDLFCNMHYIRKFGTDAAKLEPNKFVGPTEYKTAAPVVKSERKSLPAYLKVKEGEEGIDSGVVEHLISVYGVEDYGHDIAHPGMFTKTLSERMSRIRVVDNHRMDTVNSVIGVPLKLWEVGKAELPQQVLVDYPDATGGLMAETQFLLDTPEGKGAFTRIKSGAISEFSFAYDALDYDFEETEGRKKIRNLRTVRLWEYGPVVFGMNPAAVSVVAKSSDHLEELGVRMCVEAEDYAILYKEDTKEYLRAAFEVDEEGVKVYEDEANWKAGNLEFVPIPTQEELDLEEQATVLKSQIIELELEFLKAF